MSFDKDAVITEAEFVGEYLGGKLYKQGLFSIVVCTGTYRDMGKQYGHFLKEQLTTCHDTLKSELIDTGTMTWQIMKDTVASALYQTAPKKYKEIYAGVAEETGFTEEEVCAMDQQLVTIIVGRRAACTACSAWGDRTVDGNCYMVSSLHASQAKSICRMSRRGN